MPESITQPAAPAGWSLMQALKDGREECAAGLANWRIAHLDGTAVLRRRYARSTLGQFWLTLSTGASIAALGAVWTVLWKQPVREIFPYIAISLVLWNFLSALVTEGANTFVSQAHTLSNQGLAVSTFVYSLLYKTVIVLAHDAVIILVVMAVFRPDIGVGALLFIPAFALTLIAGFCVSYLTAMLCARFRDVILLSATVMQLMFYVTPVLWKRDFLPQQYAWITEANPFAAFLSLLRDPLLAHETWPQTWAYVIALTATLVVITLAAAGTVRRRLIYWI